jgi:hypothetical protein
VIRPQEEDLSPDVPQDVLQAYSEVISRYNELSKTSDEGGKN